MQLAIITTIPMVRSYNGIELEGHSYSEIGGRRKERQGLKSLSLGPVIPAVSGPGPQSRLAQNQVSGLEEEKCRKRFILEMLTFCSLPRTLPGRE